MEEAPHCFLIGKLASWMRAHISHGIVLLIHDGMIGRQHSSYIGLQFSLISPDVALVSVSQE